MDLHGQVVYKWVSLNSLLVPTDPCVRRGACDLCFGFAFAVAFS